MPAKKTSKDVRNKKASMEEELWTMKKILKFALTSSFVHEELHVSSIEVAEALKKVQRARTPSAVMKSRRCAAIVLKVSAAMASAWMDDMKIDVSIEEHDTPASDADKTPTSSTP